MQDNEKNPALRFKGFTDPWEQRKLGDVADIVGGGTPSTNNPNYWDGDIDWYAPAEIAGQIYFDSSQRKITEQGYENSSAKMLPPGTVLFTSRAGIGKTAILSKKGCTNQGFQSIVPHNDELDSYFVFSRTDELKQYGELVGAGSTFVEVSGKQMAAMNLKMPTTIEEQQTIGRFFKRLDTLITLHQRKYEKLVNIKKSMLNKMFPPNGASVPEIRFKGFTDPWEQRKLKELYFQLTERNTDLLPYQKTLSVATMSFKTDGNGAADTSLANYKRLRTGDIAFEGHTSKEFRYGRFVLNDVGDGIMSPRFSALRPLHEMPINFWKYYIHYEPIMRKVLVNSTKAGTMMNELVINDFLQGSILVPSMTEQQAIGRFFKQLDTLITLHQRKLEKLQNIKKSCLEKMFV